VRKNALINFIPKVHPIAKRSSGEIKILVIEDLLDEKDDSESIGADAPEASRAFQSLPDPSAAAMLLYTSGTTGPPKGVVLTVDNIINQYKCQLGTWGWNEKVINANYVFGGTLSSVLAASFKGRTFFEMSFLVL
jgi:acyl-CoA synthetase (AMP-forming)/AMP-acid ligase II